MNEFARAIGSEPCSQAWKQHLAAYFVDDVQQTVELCPEIDLALWPDFVAA